MDLGATGWYPALDAISNTLAENSLKLIALRGLAEQTDKPAPDEAVLDAMDALL
jgi:phycocyanobilin lyase alpha subunit